MARKKSLSKRIFRTRAMHFMLSVIASLLMRFIYLTSRVEKRFPDVTLPYLRGENPAIFCFWHGRMIMHPFVKPPGRTMSVLISHHNDGALITETMRRFGVGSVRGSKKLGGTKALLDLFRVTEAGGNISITPDGPRGPFQKAAPGAAYVAAKTGYPLIPITFSANRYWRFGSWDKFMLPKPFSRILFIAGTPITATGEDEKAGAAITATLEADLAFITQEADLARDVIPASPLIIRQTQTDVEKAA